ncbi:hypothetical protein QET40_06935 [Akkermansia sp. N21169]|uniref:hypothetical protein n=1 Tax=Akkermansia sp. N21169 TaxID=3040765 RepID=UPI00244EA162|nr:hypothetical protein [Akkermansia sp. N21169]MDH3068848.1 hypothetical protein [Akkermansia sp. N21169]
MNDNKEEIKMEELDEIVGGSMTATLTSWTNEAGIPCIKIEVTGGSSVGHLTIKASDLDKYKERHSDWTFKMNQ